MKVIKRTFWILATVLVVIAGTGTLFFLIRKNKVLDQYVHPRSQAIVSISLDDLLLDNIDQILSRRSGDSVASAPSLFDFEPWWKAGINIPAQIHLFTLNDNPWTFFTIQKIKNPRKWKAFLKNHLTDSVQAITPAEQQVSFAHLSSHVSARYDNQYVLLRFALTKQDHADEMHEIWGEKKSWTYVRDIPFPPAEHPKADVVYRRTDGTFQLFADIDKELVSLSGDWQLQADIPTLTPMRIPKMDDDTFLTFWSSLPLLETPFLTTFLSVFSAIEPDHLIAKANGYINLFIDADLTTQRDTIIAYDYDADFNTIEKKEIQETSVPIIESVWQDHEQLTTILPEKLFYRFYQYTADSVVLLSTKEDAEFSSTFFTTRSPFALSVRFENLPSLWAVGVAKRWQQEEVKIRVTTALSHKRTLKITGNIRYEEK